MTLKAVKQRPKVDRSPTRRGIFPDVRRMRSRVTAQCNFRGRGNKSGENRSYTARRCVSIAAYRTGSDLTLTLDKKLSGIGTGVLEPKVDEWMRTPKDHAGQRAGGRPPGRTRLGQGLRSGFKALGELFADLTSEKHGPPSFATVAANSQLGYFECLVYLGS